MHFNLCLVPDVYWGTLDQLLFQPKPPHKIVLEEKDKIVCFGQR